MTLRAVSDICLLTGGQGRVPGTPLARGGEMGEVCQNYI